MHTFQTFCRATFSLAVTTAILTLTLSITCRADPQIAGNPQDPFFDNPLNFPKTELRQKPIFKDFRAKLNESDFRTALTALQIALDETGDGRTFIWQKKNNGLKGMVKPTRAFRDSNGRICRHIILSLSIDRYLKTIEGVACRESNGLWTVNG